MTTVRNRVKIRKALLLMSALLFPLTMLYFSPGLVFRGARLGIVTGSYITFAALFVTSIFFGRAWCGLLCPGGGLCELARSLNDRPFRPRPLRFLKYIVWVVWIASIILVAIFIGKGFHGVDPLLGTAGGISIHSPELVGFYYLVVSIVMALSLIFGRRGFCHALCWMAPFLVLGRTLRNTLRTPALQLAADGGRCTGCGVCETVCPMSLPVKDMIDRGRLEHVDCILCGSCAAACPTGTLWMEIGSPLHINRGTLRRASR
jgi:polyferredoxin